MSLFSAADRLACVPASEYQPQLATLVREPPSGEEWLHEIKYDGYRIGARIRGGRIALYSRNGKDWTAAFPEIVAALDAMRLDDALFDGEAAMVLPDGRTSFQALQNAASSGSRRSLAYFVFDLLRADGKRIEQLPLEERKARLRAIVGKRKTGVIRYSEHVTGSGDAFFNQACRIGLEGIISKRRDAPYRHGRHPDWLKTKCVKQQEFVIGGFTDPEGSRVGIGALLIGYYDKGGRLVFAGKVGTGFTHRVAIDLRRRLEKVEQAQPPFAVVPAGGLPKRAHWVKPRLVAELVFTEWTEDGKIRHPSFLGLRDDKPASDVRKEEPAAAAAPSRKAVARSDLSIVQGVRISHPDRVVYPTLGLTKLDVARYYESIAKWIVPHVRGRPLTLVRCPEGMRGECFYMKHSKLWSPPALRRVRIQEKTKLGEYLIADNIAGVVGLVQMGVLEIHTWNADFDRVEQPNRLVFDLDPGEDVTWPGVVEAARVVRAALQALGLKSWVKTTGGRGLHVVVPLVPAAEWNVCLDFSRRLAETIERSAPEKYTTNFAKAGRRRKILVDYLRNNRTNTSVAAYSTRAKQEAPVSMPLTWRELTAALDPAAYTIHTVPKRLAKLKKDPWADYWQLKQKLTRQVLKALGL
jgi:bifunctional non-homologous end joining protein LigD